MSAGDPKEPRIRQVADEVAAKLIEHIRDDTAEDDARREAERDARVARALRELAAQGKLPPRRS